MLCCQISLSPFNPVYFSTSDKTKVQTSSLLQSGLVVSSLVPNRIQGSYSPEFPPEPPTELRLQHSFSLSSSFSQFFSFTLQARSKPSEPMARTVPRRTLQKFVFSELPSGDSHLLVTVAKCLKEATEELNGLVWAQGFRALGSQCLVL